MNLVTLFEKQIATFDSKTAIVMRQRYRTMRWSYRELGEKTKKLSQILAAKDVHAGDRVLLFSSNSPYWEASFFAILYRGAIVVPLNPQSPVAQLNRIVDKVKPKLLLKSVRLPWPAEKLPTVEMELAIEDSGGSEEKQDSENLSLQEIVPPLISPNDLAEIIFTSGTTGDPKGVMLTHNNLISNLTAISEALPLKATDHMICILPLFHMYAQMTGMLYPFNHGAAVTYLPSIGSRVIRETLTFTPATHLITVPEFLKTVINRLEKNLEEHHLGTVLSSPLLRKLPLFCRHYLLSFIRRRISKTLHTIASGGAPLDAEVELKWRTLGFHLLQGYGLTETSPIATINTHRKHRVGTVGYPLPGVQIKLSPDGEILIKGPNVTPGYYQDEQYTHEVFDEGWFKTGDGGRINKEGYLSVLGRKKYMILGPGGENVFPEDIEVELNKVLGVKDSAVVGLEVDGRTSIHAVLLCDVGDVNAIIEDANQHLAPHQQIMEGSLWPQADFPRSATRKVKKEEVLKWLKSRKPEVRQGEGVTVTPLIRLLAHVTECDPQTIHPETRIVPELHLDSLLRVELVSRIEEELDITIEERFISPKTTFEELENLVSKRKGKSVSPPKIKRAPYSLFANSVRPLLQYIMVFSWFPLCIKLRVSGLENLKGLKGPVIFMPNHKCFLDTGVVLRALPSQFRRRSVVAASTEVVYIKYRWGVPLAEMLFNTFPFATESDENIKPSLDYTGRLIDKGWNLIIYPEGHMNVTNRPLLPLKGGTGVLAVEMQTFVVPMTLKGTEIIMPPGKFFPRARGVVEVRFGKPTRFQSNESYQKATQEIEQAQLELLK